MLPRFRSLSPKVTVLMSAHSHVACTHPWCSQHCPSSRSPSSFRQVPKPTDVVIPQTTRSLWARQGILGWRCRQVLGTWLYKHDPTPLKCCCTCHDSPTISAGTPGAACTPLAAAPVPDPLLPLPHEAPLQPAMGVTAPLVSVSQPSPPVSAVFALCVRARVCVCVCVLVCFFSHECAEVC